MKRKPPRKHLVTKVETLLEAGLSGADGEGLLESGHVYGVFDAGESGAIAKEVFGDRTRAPLVELCLEANRRIGEAKAARGTTATVVRLEAETFEWVAIGRAELVVVRADGSFEQLATAEARALDGSPDVEAHVRAGKRVLAGVRQILVFTAGLLAPGSELGELVDHCLDGGLSEAFAALGEQPERAGVAAVAISFLPPNPVTLRKRAPRSVRKLLAAKRSSGVPSRRRRGRS